MSNNAQASNISYNPGDSAVYFLHLFFLSKTYDQATWLSNVPSVNKSSKTINDCLKHIYQF